MKKSVILIFAMVLMISVNAWADTQYVNDITEITMRAGPGINFRVIKTLKSGETVNALSSKNGWTGVSTESGKIGWVVSRYLTNTKPASVLLSEVQGHLTSLQTQLTKLTTDNDQLTKENQALKDQLGSTTSKLAKQTKAYEELISSSKNYLKVKAQNKKLRLALDSKTSRVRTLESRIANRYLSLGIKWFLAGAGVLIIGLIIGLSTKRKRSPLR